MSFNTKKLASAGLMGSYRSAYRGRGIEFEEVREYQPGDEIRSIDWKVSARTGETYVKSYREERDLTVMLAVDVSASTLCSTKGLIRSSLIAQVAAMLAFTALHNRDRIGLLTFGEEVQTYLPPKRSRSSVWRILHEILETKETQKKTNIARACSFLTEVVKGHAVIFVLSDFKSPDFEKEIAVLAKRHDVTAIRVIDPSDQTLTGSGALRMNDPETGTSFILDLSNQHVKNKFHQLASIENRIIRQLLRKRKIDLLELSTDAPFIQPLRKFFMARQSSGASSRHVEIV